jgi:anti-anti-sigma factor
VDAEVAVSARLDGHVVLLYASERERIANLTAWVGRGLERGEKVLLTWAPGEPRNRALELCAEGGLDVDAAQRSGQVQVLPASEFYPQNGQPEVVDRALAEGFSGVRLSAPATAALDVMSSGEYLALEEAMDVRCRNGRVSVMCQYARPATAGDWLQDTLSSHGGGMWSTGFSAARAERGVCLWGEVDLLNGDVLAAVVHAAMGPAFGTVTEEGGHEVLLDLSGLDFIDVAGCRVLVRETADFRRDGGRLRLIGARAAVARTLGLMELDAVPGVQVVRP